MSDTELFADATDSDLGKKFVLEEVLLANVTLSSSLSLSVSSKRTDSYFSIAVLKALSVMLFTLTII